MADISITANNVKPGTNAQTKVLNAAVGTTITAGQGMYIDTSTNPNCWKLGNASTSGTTASVTAVSLNGAQPGQPVVGQLSGIYTTGASGQTVGTIYVVSHANSGGIAPSADLQANDYVTIVGYAVTSTTMQLGFNATGLLHG